MIRLFIISNESISNRDGKFYCDNIDLKSTPEGLDQVFNVNLLGRSSNINRSHEIKVTNVKIFSSIFSYLFSVLKSLKDKQSKYLVISITPYTFFITILLKIFGKSPFVYLRSDGYKEYKAILGPIGVPLYSCMFNIVSLFGKLISCSKQILRNKKGHVVFPSQLDQDWFKNLSRGEIEQFKLLYVGRLRIEKGIFSLLSMIKGKNLDLAIVGAEKNFKNNYEDQNIKIYPNESNKKRLIKIYDDHNIFVLPSFTEGHPMALIEALARRRPVIIFKEIQHVIDEKKGIFVSERNIESFLKTLNFVKSNYSQIIKEMELNKLPTKKDFIIDMAKIISK